MNKRTKGDWHVEGPSQNGHCRRIFSGDEFIAIVGGSDQPMVEIRANADLMATSPELLSILETIIEQLDSPCGTVCSDTYDEAKAIVKKAKGQE